MLGSIRRSCNHDSLSILIGGGDRIGGGDCNLNFGDLPVGSLQIISFFVVESGGSVAERIDAFFASYENRPGE